MGEMATIGNSYPAWPGWCQRTGAHLTASRIIQAVSATTGVSVREMCGTVQTARASDARHLAAHLMRDIMGLSYSQIGRALGDRDHTTTLRAAKLWPARRAKRDLYGYEARVRRELGAGRAKEGDHG